MTRHFAIAVSCLSVVLVGTMSMIPGPSVLRAAAQDAAAARTVWDGVYTQEQSKRGESVSDASCTPCHGDKLNGSDIGPALQGADFLTNWSGKTADELFDKIRTTMPADSPGTLKPQQYADLLAYIF